ncbi:histidine--tRNA ligase, cytoplasmic [Magnolia sinica]|uniref:histidine--tRNA ligase, cytoplasmic n=1 Tax=Magnolia sinica TaxID=86752 RepID=UPI00265A7532|nr:histidine--tRNA ligase, cytoplasmic [Magnolia sinica]
MAVPTAIVIGGKGSSLSSTTIYTISTSISSKVEIDSSLLEKLSRSPPKKPNSSSSYSSIPPPSSPKTLTLEESRASLLVLLNKLLAAGPAVRPALALLIQETLNHGFPPEALDFSSPFQLLDSILKLNRKNFEDIGGATAEEIGVVEYSFAAVNGISAILDCNFSVLGTVVDAVAALSCEAAKADVAAFDLPVSGEGFSIKDEMDVASDMKDLLFGSKFVGRAISDAFTEIPMVHGSLRGAARSVHARTRVELNSAVRIGKTACGSSGKGKAWVATVLPLAMSIRSVGECSLGRAKLTIGSIDDADLRSQVVEVFEKSCPGLEVLRKGFELVLAKAASESDYIGILHEIYDLMVGLRAILAWEAALALFVLELHESSDKTQVGLLSNVEANGGNANVERKNEKKKKKVLGKGTAVIRQLVKDRLESGTVASADSLSILTKWARELSSFFDPKVAELDTLLKKVKAIVESNEVRRLPKIPKGTRDFGKEEMAIRERAFSIIVGVFKRHGAVALDTPVFELRETLMGKYGEDSKLIYDLADQGGEICSLRYDLTVPFARYLAMYNINTFKRYQIAKVYRRDNPSKGRYREFYQCDFDIAGQYEVMEPDFEVIKVLTELLDELSIGDYEIKLNHRKLLDGMLEICGVSPEKFRTVCSSIDKLDKQSFEQVKKELVEDKGLPVETAEKIGSFVKKRGPPLEILSDLKQEGSQFLKNEGSLLALNELEILFRALEKSKCINKVSFDLSLARGLDYYTGVIFEAVFKGGATQVGSIAAGGRYDNLVGMFSGKQVPAVGVSLGIERVFAIMEQIEKDRNQAIRPTETQVLVVLVGKDLALAAELVSELWNAKIKAEFAMTKRVMKQIDRAKQSGIPWMVIVGDSELEKGVANIKDVAINNEVTVPRDQVVEELRRRLNPTSQQLSNSYVVV